jgi:hypothetical protein
MKSEGLMVGKDSEPEGTCSGLGGTHFTTRKKILMKILEFERSRIGIIAEFRRIPSRFPNQGSLSTLFATMNQQLDELACYCNNIAEKYNKMHTLVTEVPELAGAWAT